MTLTRFDYFREEAADYLRQLGPLLAAKSPPMEALIRLARGLRGAATLAGPPSLARATRELERGIKGLGDGTFDWASASVAIRKAVEGLLNLVSSSMPWSDDNDRAAASVAGQLGSALGQPGPVAQPAAPTGGSAAMRAFLAQEGISVAAAVELALDRGDQTTIGQARVAMQTVQGLAGLGEHPPLPELLNALEVLLAEFAGYPTLPGEARGALARFVTVLRRTSGRLAAGSAAGEEDTGMAELAAATHAALYGPGMLVPIGALLAGPLPEASVPYGTGASGPSPANPIELSALGDSLRYAADQLRAAPTTQTFRLAALTQSVVLRASPGGLGHRPAGQFLADTLRRLELAGAGQSDPALPELLDTAGAMLAQQAGGDLLHLGERLAELSGDEIVSIDDLLADTAPPATITPIAEAARDRTQLERSFMSYARLVAANAPATPLAAVTAPPAARLSEADESDVVPIEALLLEAPDGGIVPIESLLFDAEPAVVAIETLLYRGRRALERANQIRKTLEDAIRESPGDVTRLQPVMRELFDLVPLALTSDV